jgi:hypothetical protein
VLLNAGANPSITTNCKDTPLYKITNVNPVEVEEVQLAIMNQLVMHGANINFLNENP